MRRRLIGMLLLAVATAAPVMAAPSGAMGKTGRPFVQQVTGVPKLVVAGKRFRVTIRARSGPPAGARTTVRLWLSKDRRKGKGDVRLRGEVVIGGRSRRGRGAIARAAASATGSGTVWVAGSVPAGGYTLLACAVKDCVGVRDEVEVTVEAPRPLSGIVAGQVQFTGRDCRSGPGSLRPLRNAQVGFTDGTRNAGAVLGLNGEFRVRLPSAGPWVAYAVMTGTRLGVGPDAEPFAPYRVPVRITGSPDALRLVIGGGKPGSPPDPGSGAASIYSALDEAAVAAKVAWPVGLPRVQVRWRYAADLTTWLGDRVPSQYDDTEQRLYVGGTLKGSYDAKGTFQGLQRDEYERFPLMHEYGHHVLHVVADPGTDAGGDHGFATVHPDKPALPWSEGFANAFAAIASGRAQQTLGCKVRMDLATFPASATQDPARVPITGQPAGVPSALAQVNETAVAGSLWTLTSLLGGGTVNGDPAHALNGLGTLLKSLNAAHSASGGPSSLRGVRDALITGGGELTQADHDRNNLAFYVHGITGWGVAISVGTTDWGPNTCILGRDDPGGCRVTDPLVLSGPGYSCSSVGPTPWPQSAVAIGDFGTDLVGQAGGIGWAKQDDCFNNDENVWLRYPFPGGPADPRAMYEVTLRYSCEDNPAVDPNNGITYGICPNSVEVSPTINTALSVPEPATADVRAAMAYGDSLSYRRSAGTMIIRNRGSVTIARFSADGLKCLVGAGPQSCGF